jgi:hypothetical protein
MTRIDPGSVTWFSGRRAGILSLRGGTRIAPQSPHG